MIVYLTTPTSGSQSIYRILCEYGRALGERVEINRGSDLKKFSGIHEDRKYVVNFRDPRDIWCNQFYWLIQHDAANDEVVAERRARYDKGIEFSVRQAMNAFSKNGDPSSNVIKDLIEKECHRDNIMFVSYAQLCMCFEEMILRLNKYLGVELSVDNNEAIRRESPAALEENSSWIGNAWVGCDVMPGRHKKELSQDFINELNDVTREYNQLLKTVELEPLRHLYD